ncbi:alpha/beta hydrolase [Vallicoccus soli]|uniref:Phospholipase n=1 Tax=Vallicoccus soli TaxID=2339232 RepID=A0A3A3ZHM3_9ACTN|nr:phospholipase [Vallicoccus soli]RJK94776.1 phospholipase [Vallicoccus soli]
MPEPDDPGAAGVTALPQVRELALPGRRPPLLLVPPGADEDPAPRPLLVFLHGAGGTGEQGVPLLRGAAAAHGALALLTTSRGATWDLLLGRLGPDADALDAALDQVRAERAVGRLALGGFSDGASYALSLGLAAGDRYEALLAFSPGFAAPPRRVGLPRAFVAHGTDDAVLPVERCGRPVARDLRGRGHEVRYEEFRGGHVVPRPLVDAALAWWLDGPAPARGV